ncbi:MAG: type IV pilus modification PilV family protein [Gammaproteobacteria bacterium]
MNGRPSIRHVRQAGLTYVETLVATLILLIGLIPAMDALRSAVSGTATNEGYVADQYRLVGRFEEVLAEPFGNLDAAAGPDTTPSAYSEPGGTPGRLVIYIARYDGDNADADGDPFTGADDDLLWVRAEIENTPQYVETVVSR